MTANSLIWLFIQNLDWLGQSRSGPRSSFFLCFVQIFYIFPCIVENRHLYRGNDMTDKTRQPWAQWRRPWDDDILRRNCLCVILTPLCTVRKTGPDSQIWQVQIWNDCPQKQKRITAGRHWIGGGKGGGNTEGATKKRFWCDFIFSCNRRLRESFSVCSIEVVSLQYGWTYPTDKFQKCFAEAKHFKSILPKQNTFFKSVLEIQNNFRSVLPKTLSVPPKHFCVLALKIQNNLYSHSIYKFSMLHHESDDLPCPPLPRIMPMLPQPPPLLPLPPPPSPQQ